MYKFETPHFQRRVKRINVNRGISARKDKMKTHLCDREIPCGTYQLHCDSEVQAARISSEKAHIEST